MKRVHGCFLFIRHNSMDATRNMTWKLYLKWFALLLAVWVMFLIKISRDLKSYIWQDQTESYETALNRLRRNTNSDKDRLEAWNLLGEVKYVLSSEYKLVAVQNENFPPGNFGLPVVLKDSIPGTLEMLVRKGWQEHSYNQFVSDLVPIERLLPDVRDKRCSRHVPENLPKASVVIVFYNEAWSALLRTIHSVINRSPKHLLDQIILVDDYSTMSHLKHRLGEYIRALPKVTLIRTMRREGLIRARILGTKHVNSPVVIFLDSHCECTIGWLEPLLERIAEDPTIVVSPMIDHIDDRTFQYIAQNDITVGGFTWELQFIWRHILNKKAYQKKQLLPIKTPTIAGGLFAISKEFFKRIGYYDESFEIWGAENLELSFKTWMCGGSLEIAPCSHVGHVFRKSFPYSTNGSILKNNMRLAEVWMDDYAKYFYQRIGNKRQDFGDVTKQKELRKKLQCKSFDWYIKNVYPELKITENVVAYGQIHDMHGTCLDSSVLPANEIGTVKLAPCHGRGGNQFWEYTTENQVKRDDKCLEYIFSLLILRTCQDHAETQKWLFENKTKYLRHEVTRDCLKNARFNDSRRLILERCFDEKSQIWVIE